MLNKIASFVAAATLLTAGGTATQAATLRGFPSNSFLEPSKLIGPAQADAIALKAVGGGKVIQTQIDNQPAPLHYSVDILQPVYEYEVWVNARTGVVMKIFRQHR